MSLRDSRSPFLQHGATQPVAWLPWGEEAFDRARREDKPVLLDIGAVWCHWCHVMDHESYEDEETATLINERFVPVKVDRDERPDVDARYQRAVQALSGQGGWPLTAFLTPDGEAFFGGTYFPPDDRHGRPSFRRVLGEISRVWEQDRGRAREAAAQLRDRLAAYARAETQPGRIGPELVDAAVEAFADDFDFRYGGFGRAPKFPNAGAVELLLDRWLDAGEEWAQRIVVETLRGMGRGGIHDQLGGGFHRYATDNRWLVPHFEKMAYDNGVLLGAYPRAHAALGDPFFREVAEGVLDHYADVAPDLLEAGGFPASQDADIGPTDDGSHWTWSRAELHEALDGDERRIRAAVLRYGFDDPGSALHGDPSRRVPYRALEADEVAARMDVDGAAARELLEEVRRRLKAARDRRPRPYVDETLYTGWVALVASGFLAAARHLGRDDAGEAALRALDRIWAEAHAGGRGVVRRVGDPDSGAFLEDQAYTAQALLDAFELTQQPRYLDRAAELVAVMVARFRDADGSGFADRPVDEDSPVPALEAVHRPIVDAPSPAANAVAALVMLRTAALRQDPELRDRAVELLSAFAGSAPRVITGAATYARAVDWATSPVTTVVVVGEAGDPAADALFRAALAAYRPRTVLRRFEPGRAPADELPTELAAMLTGDAPRAYVCVGQSCAPPADRPAMLVETLRTFR